MRGGRGTIPITNPLPKGSRMSTPRRHTSNACPDCQSTSNGSPSLPSRRDVLRRAAAAGAVGAAAAGGLLSLPRLARAAETGAGTAAASKGALPETLVAQLYGTLNEEQKKA